MYRQRIVISVGLVSFGAGLVLATAVPFGLLMFLIGIILILAGVFFCKNY